MISLRNIKIVSGGQTGVDRAALDFAIKWNMKCGGWCPKGRKAEDGRIPEHYPLKEAKSEDYALRTRKNVEDSDGTLIIYDKKFDSGTGLTLDLCRKLKKPWILIRLTEGIPTNKLLIWLKNIQVLNIAGPRESSEPGIYFKTIEFLESGFLIDP